jgi:hypothetical protein
MYVMCPAAMMRFFIQQYDHKLKSAKTRKKGNQESRPLPAAAPTLAFTFPLNVNHHIHPSLSRQIIDAVPHVFEVGVRRCDDVDHAADSGLRVSWPMVVPVRVVVVRVRFVSVIEPEAWHGVADHSTQFAEFLERHFDGVLEIFWHD